MLLRLGARCCRFESCHFDHKSTMVLYQNHLAFSIHEIPCAARSITIFTQAVSFIVIE